MSIFEISREILSRVESGGMYSAQQIFFDAIDTPKSSASVHDHILVTIATPNPEQIVMASENARFWENLRNARIFFLDGTGLVFANFWWKVIGKISSNSSFFLSRTPGRVVVEWWLSHNSERVSTERAPHKTLLLGAREGVAERLAMQQDSEHSWCIGMTGYSQISDLFDAHPSAKTREEHKLVMEFIKTWQPEIIFIAFGAPWQEAWMQKYEKVLVQSGVRVAMVCGGSFDVLVGDVSTPPKLVSRFGLEWIWRLFQQPWRWRRQRKLLKFFVRIFI